MKYRMKSLKHNGIYVPPYEYLRLSVKVQGITLKLSPKTEQMAMAWARKKLSVTSPPDKLFYRNFLQDFLEALSTENPSQGILKGFTVRHIGSLENDNNEWMVDGKLKDDQEVDFSAVTEHVLREQKKKLNLTKEEFEGKP
jgi:hypothetical protein